MTDEQRAELLRRIDAIPADATRAHPAVSELIAYLRSEDLGVADHRIRIAESAPELAAALARLKDWAAERS